MFVWLSKGMISMSRDYHNGVLLGSDDKSYSLSIIGFGEFSTKPLLITYDVLEKDAWLADYQIVKDVILNLHRQQGSMHPPRMFNPPSDLPAYSPEVPERRTRQVRQAQASRANDFAQEEASSGFGQYDRVAVSTTPQRLTNSDTEVSGSGFSQAIPYSVGSLGSYFVSTGTSVSVPATPGQPNLYRVSNGGISRSTDGTGLTRRELIDRYGESFVYQQEQLTRSVIS